MFFEFFTYTICLMNVFLIIFLWFGQYLKIFERFAQTNIPLIFSHDHHRSLRTDLISSSQWPLDQTHDGYRPLRLVLSDFFLIREVMIFFLYFAFIFFLLSKFSFHYVSLSSLPYLALLLTNVILFLFCNSSVLFSSYHFLPREVGGRINSGFLTSIRQSQQVILCLLFSVRQQRSKEVLHDLERTVQKVCDNKAAMESMIEYHPQ